jgi:hypothetical protein
MNRIGQAFKDPDVKRSLAYLAISLTISAGKATADYIRERRENG